MNGKDMQKELRYGLRESKFLILAAGFLFFALMTPVMTKLMPEIMKSQFPDMPAEAVEAMMDRSQLGCVQSYMGDVFEIGTIIVVFTLCGILSQEIREKTLILPVCSGKGFGGTVLAKFIVFGAALLLLPMIALLTDYAYAGLLLGFDIPSLWPVVRGGLLQGVYMLFLLACLMLAGTLMKSPVAAGMLTLAIAYGSHFLGSLLNILPYLPTGVLVEAQKLSEVPASSLPLTILIAIGCIVAFGGLAVWRLKSMELAGK
jgi:ABC-2 type transport system permease protein